MSSLRRSRTNTTYKYETYNMVGIRVNKAGLPHLSVSPSPDMPFAIPIVSRLYNEIQGVPRVP